MNSNKPDKAAEHKTGMKHGLYKIYWKEERGGGASLASVGYTHDGSNWFAPCNWTSENNHRPFIATTDWSDVQRYELLIENDYENGNLQSSQSGKERAALEKIAQMSDPGSYEKAIIEMKRIASDALSTDVGEQDELWEKLIEILSNSLSEELMSINDIDEAKKQFSLTRK